MLKIFNRVLEVFKKDYSKKSDEFKEGARTILALFEIGIRKSNFYNQALRVREQEVEINKLKATIVHLREEVSHKQDKIFELSLISGEPSKKFVTYDIAVAGQGMIEIVTNIDIETMQVCMVNFNQKHTFKRKDEAKSKLLSFINTKNHLGFKAYKDWKTYKKEHKNN